jgi:4-amino-4-deoxychorismate mutase
LEPLRNQLDDLDGALLTALRQRFEVCDAIAGIKKREDIPLMQPQRIQAVRERWKAYGQEHGISTDFLVKLHALVIEEACRREALIIGE